jgi:GNAT superfamily N-acetyltransferase
MSDGSTLRVVPWSQTHVPWLRHAIGEFFEAGLARGGDLLRTPRNVDAYLALGLAGAEAGDPCLLALVEDVPVAFVMWTGFPDVLDCRWRTVHAVGSYTEPQWRNKTIATALRETAICGAKARGYERAIGPVFHSNARGIYEFCVNYGAWPMSTNFELRFT